jgi:hypothetical protein
MPYKPTGRRVGRPEKEDAFKPVSVKLPPDLLARVRKYALIHQQSLSELIRDGLDLLRAHPEGLSAEQIRGFLNPAKPLGDTLQGMRRQAVVRTEGKGRELRYFLA